MHDPGVEELLENPPVLEMDLIRGPEDVISVTLYRCGHRRLSDFRAMIVLVPEPDPASCSWAEFFLTHAQVGHPSKRFMNSVSRGSGSCFVCQFVGVEEPLDFRLLPWEERIHPFLTGLYPSLKVFFPFTDIGR